MSASTQHQGKMVIEGQRVPCGYQQITDLSAAVGLTVPNDGAKFALIQCETQDVRWKDDGTSPTSSSGMYLQRLGVIEYNGDLHAIKFIETSASAKLNVSYYK